MTQEEIIEMARRSGALDFYEINAGIDGDEAALLAFAKLVAQHERERIKQANAPEIERVNAHIKQLEDAVIAERERIFGELLKMHEKESSRHNYYLNAVLTIKARGKA